MGQNLALNIAEKIGPAGQSVAVCNRSPAKVDETVARAAAEGGLPLFGYKDVRARPGSSLLSASSTSRARCPTRPRRLSSARSHSHPAHSRPSLSRRCSGRAP